MKKFILILGLLVSLCSLLTAKDWDDETFHFRLGGGAGLGVDLFSEPQGSSVYYNQFFIDIQGDFLFSLVPGFRMGPSVKLNVRWDPFANRRIFEVFDDFTIGMGLGLHIEIRIIYFEGGVMYDTQPKKWSFVSATDILFGDDSTPGLSFNGYTQIYFEAGLRLPFTSKQAHGGAINVGIRDTPFGLNVDDSWEYINWLDTLSAHLSFSYTFKKK